MVKLNEALSLLPGSLNVNIKDQKAEEIRIRSGRRVYYLKDNIEIPASSAVVTDNDIKVIVERATGASVHAVINSLKDGYIMCGDLRIGLCGRAVVKDGAIFGLSRFTSLAIRIPHECRGICRNVTDRILSEGMKNILIIAPPGGGKTTALREIVRYISDRGSRVAVADERGEISSGFDLGEKTDIITGLNKKDAAMILLRSMNPSVLAFDEISKRTDIETIYEAAGCGVKLIATAHAASFDDLCRRQVYRELIDEHIFERLITISGYGSRSYEITEL